MKLLPAFLTIVLLAVTACSTSSPSEPATAQSNSPGLPFGDMRFLAPPQIDEKPAPTFMPSPFALKAEFAKRGLSGDAVISFTISTQGKPEKIKIVQSTNQALAQIAANYVAALAFRPARVGGAPVACDAEMPFFNK